MSVDGKIPGLSATSKTNRAAIWDPGGFGEDETVPSLSGSFDCPRRTDRPCVAKLFHFRSRAAEYPGKINRYHFAAPEDAPRRAMFATERPSDESWTGTEMHSGTPQMNRAIQCFYALTPVRRQGSNAEFAPAPSNPITAAEFLPPGQTDKRLADHPLGPSRDPGHIQHTPLYRAIPDRTPIQCGG